MDRGAAARYLPIVAPLRLSALYHDPAGLVPVKPSRAMGSVLTFSVEATL